MSCPEPSPYAIDPGDFTFRDTSLVLSTSVRTIGTVVNLTCNNNFILSPNRTSMTCLASGKWDYVVQCINPNPPTIAPTTPPNRDPAATSTGLTMDQKIIVGVAGAFALLFLIFLVILLFAIFRGWRRNRERQQSSGGEGDRSSVNNFVLVNNSRPYAHDSFGRNVHPGMHKQEEALNNRSYPGRVFRDDHAYDPRYPDFQGDPRYNERHAHRASRDGSNYENRKYWDNQAFDRSHNGDVLDDTLYGDVRREDTKRQRDILRTVARERLEQIEYSRNKAEYL